MKKVPLTIRLPVTLKEKLDQLKREKGLTINAIIVDTLWTNIEK